MDKLTAIAVLAVAAYFVILVRELGDFCEMEDRYRDQD